MVESVPDVENRLLTNTAPGGKSSASAHSPSMRDLQGRAAAGGVGSKVEHFQTHSKEHKYGGRRSLVACEQHALAEQRGAPGERLLARRVARRHDAPVQAVKDEECKGAAELQGRRAGRGSREGTAEGDASKQASSRTAHPVMLRSGEQQAFLGSTRRASPARAPPAWGWRRPCPPLACRRPSCTPATRAVGREWSLSHTGQEEQKHTRRAQEARKRRPSTCRMNSASSSSSSSGRFSSEPLKKAHTSPSLSSASTCVMLSTQAMPLAPPPKVCSLICATYILDWVKAAQPPAGRLPAQRSAEKTDELSPASGCAAAGFCTGCRAQS